MKREEIEKKLRLVFFKQIYAALILLEKVKGYAHSFYIKEPSH